MKYSLIIPAHNEAPVIGKTLADLTLAFTHAHGEDGWEILVIDNASTDGTSGVVRTIGDPRIRVISLEKKGKGHATRRGFEEAKGELVGFTDADLSVPPHEVARAFTTFQEGDAHILIGSRFHPESSMPGREWWRTFTSELFNHYARRMLSIPFFDTQCPLKIVDAHGRLLLLHTQEDTWYFDLEFLTLAHRLDLAVKEVPVSWDEHRYPERKSKLSTVRDGSRYLLAMHRIKSRLPEQLSLWNDSINNRVTHMNNKLKWIIVGLGNPGAEYQRTRHNVGRMVVEMLQEKYAFPPFEYKKTYDALISKGERDGKEVLMLLPETFMNESGRSLATLVKSAPQAEQLIVVHDDADLPIGSWRMAFERGAGGQKGVASIITTLKSNAFVRVRIGIAPKDNVGADRKKAGEYVLKKFTPDELSLAKNMTDAIGEAIRALMQDGLELSRSRWKKHTGA